VIELSKEEMELKKRLDGYLSKIVTMVSNDGDIDIPDFLVDLSAVVGGLLSIVGNAAGCPKFSAKEKASYARAVELLLAAIRGDLINAERANNCNLE